MPLKKMKVAKCAREENALLSQLQNEGGNEVQVQEYLAHKKQQPRRTLQYDFAQGPMVV